MTHPYIDCARRLAKKVQIEDIAEVVCEAAEGTLHRLWEPLKAKQSPPNAYAAKFSQPYCIAAGFVLGNAGLDAFTDGASPTRACARRRQGALRGGPGQPLPERVHGHVRVKLKNGSVVEERRRYPRREARAAVARDVDKFTGNCAYGGWSDAQAEAAARGAFDARTVDLSAFRK